MRSVALSRKLAVLLIPVLLLFVFLGGSHSCCACYSQTCSFCSQTDTHPILSLAQANAADALPLPAVTSAPAFCEESLSDPIWSYRLSRVRAPPCLS